MVRKLMVPVLAVLATTSLLVACSSDDGGESDTTTTAAAGAPGTTAPPAIRAANADAASTIDLVVLLRLRGSFDELADAFEAENPDIGLRVTYARRDDIGGLVDGEEVSIAIDQAAPLTEDDAEEQPSVFATDLMQIVVPVGNPAGVEDVSVFGESEVATGICEEQIDCGRGAVDVFAAAQLEAQPDEVVAPGDQLLEMVRNGDLDAGLLLRTQGATIENQQWEIVTLPDEIDASVEFGVALVRPSPEAETFVTWLLESETANEILVNRGLR
jgi:molybdate transport system substrate-binding protein